MKKLNILKKQTENKPDYFANMSDQDKIDLLAAMCLFCSPCVRHGLLVKRFRAEYVLQNRDDMELAKQLFATNGFNLKSNKNDDDMGRHACLHSRYFFRSNVKSVDVVRFMHKIEKECQVLATGNKWWELQDKLSLIRQNFNQKVK